MGPQVRLCYSMYFLGLFNMTPTLHGYNLSIVTLMGDNTEALLPRLNNTVASRPIWRSSSVATQ